MTDPTDDPTPAHKRRPRYRGSHPRKFEERYKELEAERYPEIVPHVLAKGRTPAGRHVPILVTEILAVLAPVPGARAVDATLGFGGHAERLLERLMPGGQLLGLDADPIELPRSEARLRKLGYDEHGLMTRRTNFAGLHAAIASVGWSDGVDLVLADLGLSSMQVDNPARGFTFSAPAPLDMRMNPARGISAAEWLMRTKEKNLAGVLQANADEPFAELLASLIVENRASLKTTHALAALIRGALRRHASEDDTEKSVRRVFQAIRIEVNDELNALDALLRDLPHCLRPGGRIAILTFHSGEDRRVKHAFEVGEERGLYSEIAHDVVRASSEEIFNNPRSRSAKLRWAKRAQDGE